MNRRQFILRSTWAAPALLWLPSLISSCKKTLPEDLQFKGKVIIIGAGAAGLYAAQILLERGAEVIILEASNRIGGRILADTQFSDFPIELGAEEIHGEKSIWFDAALAAGAQFIDEELQDIYYFNGGLKTEAQATENTLFNNMIAAFDDIINYTGGDTTAEVYGQISNISDNVIHLFNALVGNEHGTDNSRIGMHGLRSEEEKWTAGDNNLMTKNKSMFQILQFLCPDALLHVQKDHIVSQINYSENLTIVRTANGSEFQADAVICAVPITQLKNNSIQFTPNLPASKINAIQNIGMDRGMKIILRFSEKFWPSDMASVYSRGQIPIYWPTALGGRSEQFLLTGFVHGSAAEYLNSLGEQGIIDLALSELNEMFGEASLLFTDGFVQDWGNVPFIEGTYSYPTPNMGDAIHLLAQPLGKRLYFAGEATHTGGHTSTVHGAIETGLRAALEVIQNTPQ